MPTRSLSAFLPAEVFGRGGSWNGQLDATHATPWSAPLIATYHPSAVRRADTAEDAIEVEDQLEADLRRARELADVRLSR